MTESVSPTARLAAELYAPVTAEAAGTKATMRIFGRIDPDGAPWGVSSGDVQAVLDSLPEDVTDLEVQVQTRGGDAFEGVAIMNMIRTAKPNTEAVVVGLAASAGSYIVQGADKVTMMPHSQLMIHRGSILAIGQAPDMRMAADRLESLDKTMANIYTEKAGGTPDEWLAAMTPESWYTADEAVAAGLADGVREMPKPPAGAKASLDLSIFAYAGREHAPDPFIPDAPADQPVTPPTDHKEADTMSDTIPTAGLVKALSLADDADEDTILEAVEAKITASATPPKVTDDAVAAAYGLEPAQVKAALDAAKAGKVTVSQSFLDTLEANAKLGAEARAKQLADARDEAIQAKVAAGIIGRDQVESWQRDWDRDPASAKAELDKLTVARFPVGDAPGNAGDESAQASYTDEMAAEDAELFGLPKEAFAR